MKFAIFLLAFGAVQDKPKGLLIKRSEVMKRAPDADLGPAKTWIVERTDEVQSMLIQIDGTIPMHAHPDGVHRMYVIEGKLRVTIEDETKDLEPGDYIMIPKNAKHQVQGKGIYASVDTPPVDAKKIIWVDPPPKK